MDSDRQDLYLLGKSTKGLNQISLPSPQNNIKVKKLMQTCFFQSVTHGQPRHTASNPLASSYTTA